MPSPWSASRRTRARPSRRPSHAVDGMSITVLAATSCATTTVYFRAGEDKAGVASMELSGCWPPCAGDHHPRRRGGRATWAWRSSSACPSAKQVAAAGSWRTPEADVDSRRPQPPRDGKRLAGRPTSAWSWSNFVWFRNTTFPGRSTGVLTIEVDRAGSHGQERSPGEPSPDPVVVQGRGSRCRSRPRHPAPDPETPTADAGRRMLSHNSAVEVVL